MEFGGAGGGAGAGGAQFHFIGPGAGGPLGAGGGGFHLHGNPGDYAWGRGGLDAIITQLLNHMDGAGPPPMAKENIQEIPTVNISQEQMGKSQSCSVCWEVCHKYFDGSGLLLLGNIAGLYRGRGGEAAGV